MWKQVATFLVMVLLPVIAQAAGKPNVILIYSDDHGFADLGVQGSVADIRTPNIDALARDGIRFTHGYVSAPQCVPSRAGVITGRYQPRFGVEENGKGPLPLAEVTIAERLKPAGYVSCQVGKWHLEAPRPGKAAKQGEAEGGNGDLQFLPLNQGFEEYFTGPMNRFIASHDLLGNKLPRAPQTLTDKRFRCIWQTDAAISFIERHAQDPFFLYLAYFTPHVPLESPEPWFSRTPKDAPLQRRQALAMIAAMDDGVGRIRARLQALGIDKNTLIFFIGDNGAPLRTGAWNGSLNLPLVGEKGMLTDGGTRTPFVAAWPGMLPAGEVYEAPVINLDVAATANALAGLPQDPKLDGVNLMPYLLGQQSGNPHDALYWRWRSQAAVRVDHWKLILLGKQERFLFDLDSAEGEMKNRLADFPEIAADLEKKLMAWNATLPAPGLPREIVEADREFYDGHLHRGKITDANRMPITYHPPGTPGAAPAAAFTSIASAQGWIARNGSIAMHDGALHVNPDASAKARPFITLNNLKIPDATAAAINVLSPKGGTATIAWRTEGQKDFPPDQTASFPLIASGQWQEIRRDLPAKGTIIHLRVILQEGEFAIQTIRILTNDDRPVNVWKFDGGK